VTQGSWTDFISVAAIVIVALSPLLRRSTLRASGFTFVPSILITSCEATRLCGTLEKQDLVFRVGLLKVRADQ
jgi:hypothetical protein